MMENGIDFNGIMCQCEINYVKIIDG